MGALTIKGMELGEGIPKTIISVMDPKVDDAVATIEEGLEIGVDCFEWRVDFSENLHDAATIAEESKKVCAASPDNPVLFTMRTVESGGKVTLPEDEYIALNRAVIEAGAIDLIDIDIEMGMRAVQELVPLAKQHGVATIVSYHNFAGTPSTEWMIQLMVRMHDLGADIPKVAVMAENAEDTLRLLAATAQVARLHHHGPLLTMAMGRDGSLSRLTGEMYGSALTFCALKQASAPGQVDVAQAKRIMGELHDVIS